MSPMSKGSWDQLKTAELKKNNEPLIRFYDELTEICGRLGPQIGLQSPIQLVTHGHVALFSHGDELRIEVDEPMVRLISARAEAPLPHVTKKAAAEKVVGPVRWVGAGPDGKYEGYAGWYGRKINGRYRARLLLKFPLTEGTARTSTQGNADEEQSSKIRRRLMRI